MAGTTAYFTQGVDSLAAKLPDVIDAADRERMQSAATSYQQSGVPESLAQRVASLDPLFSALDIVEVAGTGQQPAERVAGVYFDLATQLGLPELREQIAALPGDHHWQALAKGAMLDDLTGLQRTITGEVLNGFGDSLSPNALVGAWQERNQRALERTQQLLAELKAGPGADVSMLSVALRELRHLA